MIEAGIDVPDVRAMCTTRGPWGASSGPWASANLGAGCGDDPAAVAANRAQLLAGLDGVGRIAWLRQVHGTAVHRAAADAPCDGEPEADAAVTRAPGVALAVLTADCLPILIAARDGSEVAAIHAGWRGLAAGVIEAAVTALSVPAAATAAWIGPAIGTRAYEVGGEVRESLLAADAGAASQFEPTRPGHWCCDLAGLARRRLGALGVGSVVSSGLCTASEPARFFSYRRDGTCGRMATLVWIERQ